MPKTIDIQKLIYNFKKKITVNISPPDRVYKKVSGRFYPVPKTYKGIKYIRIKDEEGKYVYKKWKESYKNFKNPMKRKFGKKLSKFQKELMEISKEKDDKKYVQMVIELLIGSGLLITAIVLLLLFLYNPKNDQITFNNTGNNNNTRISLAEQAKNYRNNEEKLNERKKPTHYVHNPKNGKNFFFNVITKKFDIPSDKHAIIVKNFEKDNNIDIVNAKTFGHYNSLKLITKKVMNDNTKDEKNLDKRITTPPSTPKNKILTPSTPKNKILTPSTPPTVEKKPNEVKRKVVQTFNLNKDTHIDPLRKLGPKMMNIRQQI